jgi:hypothetical protein
MNISQYSGSGIIDAQVRQREDLLKPSGTAIQAIIPVNSSADGPESGQNATPGASELTFDSLINTVIDTVNPLQHIPGVSTAYQETTGDTMNPIANMAGGFLFGGPVGLIAGAASSFLEMISGKSIAQHAMAMFSDSPDAKTDKTTQVASQIGDGSPMLQRDQGVSLQHYQAFATATADKNLGFGADAQTVALNSNTWSIQALQQATTAYGSANANAGIAKSSRFG